MSIKYMKKPVIVDAVQLKSSESSIREVLVFIGQDINTNNDVSLSRFGEYCDIVRREGLTLKTLESGKDTQIADIDDYIIKGIQGEFYPCKPDIFKLTYRAYLNF